MIVLKAMCLVGWTKPTKSLPPGISQSSKCNFFLWYLIGTISSLPRKLNMPSLLITLTLSFCVAYFGKICSHLPSCPSTILLDSSLPFSLSQKQFTVSVSANSWHCMTLLPYSKEYGILSVMLQQIPILLFSLVFILSITRRMF